MQHWRGVLTRCKTSLHSGVRFFGAMAAGVGNIFPDPDGVRWRFRCTNWTPSAAEWTSACRLVEPEEISRIHRFVFKRDAKAALVGRLMIRRFFTQALAIPNSELRFGRTEKGKPILVAPPHVSWNFNVSHSGDYAVFGAQKDCLIGVDVMRVDMPRRKSLTDYFELMHSQFTEREWKVIRTPSSETEQLRNFYRVWCLKESYVKALGVGIGYNVSKLDFSLPVEASDASADSIFLSIDGQVQSDWTFSEYTIDDDHVGAIALQRPAPAQTRPTSPVTVLLDIDALCHQLEPICAADVELGLQFTSKPDKPY